MEKIKFSFRRLSSEFLQNSDYINCIFLNKRYDPAILGVNYVTGSIIYSLKKLILIEIKDLEGDELFNNLVDKDDLYRFLTGSFQDFFTDLDGTAEPIAPTLFYDIECEKNLRA